MLLRDTISEINNVDINDIDWSRIGVWPLSGRIIIWVLASITVFTVAYFVFIQDFQVKLKLETINEQTLRNTFQTKVLQSTTLDHHRSLIKKMKKELNFLIAQLPKKTQVPGLLDDIDERGRISGLNIVSIKLQSEIKGEFYVTLPIEIIVIGSYHNLGSFVSGIASMSRIVTLHDFTIMTGSNSANLRMMIKAQTYRSLDEEMG